MIWRAGFPCNCRMKEKTKAVLMLIILVVSFVFVGLAITANIRDELLNTNEAWLYNLIGWCLVPCACIFGALFLYKINKKPGVLV